MVKKNAKKPIDPDFSTLDVAVSELSKQTEALLGKAEGKQPTPTLPKKQRTPETKGTSFDIIHPSKQKKSIKSTLKTVQPKQPASPALANEPEPLVLLPDHAGKSFNELEGEPSNVPPADTEAEIKEVKVPAIISHREGELSVEKEESKPEPITIEEPGEEEPAPASPPQQTVSHTAINFEEKAEEAEPSNAGGEDKDEPGKEEPKPDAGASDDHSEAQKEPAPDPPAYNSGELFTNNLVKDSEPKGYKPEDGQQKPTVFDTNEYHPELHDWSKLAHKNGAKWLILLLLLCVAGGLVYLVLSGTPLPFIN